MLNAGSKGSQTELTQSTFYNSLWQEELMQQLRKKITEVVSSSGFLWNNDPRIVKTDIFRYHIVSNSIVFIFTNPSARAGYDTRSIFKRSLTGFNLEFSFSLTSCQIKAEEPSLSYYLLWRENNWIHTFPKGISATWNAIILVKDLNSCRRVHFQRR